MTNNNIETIRHSLSHLLAAAIKELYPDVKFAIGPAIENGFYYDIDFGDTKINDGNLKEIEKKMAHFVKQNLKFEQSEMEIDEAIKKEDGEDQIYKEELLRELKKQGEAKVSYYKLGNFLDLCRGPHVESTNKIKPGSFKLTKVAGAYWRGDEKNKMLTRIYGLAFATKEELDGYIKMMEEAEKRDHRKLGKELDLFTFSEVVGKGLPLWTEKGATIRRELEKFVVEEELKRDYKHVYTPDIAKIDLYKKSGHYPYYKDSMYAPIQIDEEEYMLRPMTCPHHFELYLSKKRSYRELPMRIAELAKLYRYEQSGELSGLVRVRSFCLADAHIICKDSDQAAEEVNRALDLIEYAAQIFGLKMGENYFYRLSLGDRSDESKYYKDDKAWETAENALRKVLQSRNATFIEAEKEAAFYGPKIDIQMRDVRGKDNTAFTVQYDFVMPKRFDLKFIDQDGEEKETIVIHRSSIGAIERIMAFLIEHYAGAFPLWLSPVQVKILSVGEGHVEYCKKLAGELKSYGIRAEVDDAAETVGNKIRKAANEKVPYTLVIGDKEVESDNLAVRDRGSRDTREIGKKEFVEEVLKRIKDKK